VLLRREKFKTVIDMDLKVLLRPHNALEGFILLLEIRTEFPLTRFAFPLMPVARY
jgi:hypothetical protein